MESAAALTTLLCGSLANESIVLALILFCAMLAIESALALMFLFCGRLATESTLALMFLFCGRLATESTFASIALELAGGVLTLPGMVFFISCAMVIPFLFFAGAFFSNESALATESALAAESVFVLSVFSVTITTYGSWVITVSSSAFT